MSDMSFKYECRLPPVPKKLPVDKKVEKKDKELTNLNVGHLMKQKQDEVWTNFFSFDIP